MIIGGHSHTFIDEPAVVNGIPIVQAGTGTDQIGRFDIIVNTDDNCIESYSWKPIPINSETCPRDEAIEQIIGNYKHRTDEKYGRIITKFVSNLAIVTDNTDIADITELWLAIRETIEVLQDTGISAFIDICGHTDVQADRMLASYEFFEIVIEQAIPGLKSIFVKLSVGNDSPGLRILIDAGKELRFDVPGIEKIRRLGADIDSEYEDGTYAIGLTFGEGGTGV